MLEFLLGICNTFIKHLVSSKHFLSKGSQKVKYIRKHFVTFSLKFGNAQTKVEPDLKTDKDINF